MTRASRAREVGGLRRYLRLLRIFWSNAVTTDLEYRVNFWSNAFLNLFWLGWAAAGIGVYFRFTHAVRGWTYPEMLVVVGLFFAVNGIRQAVITPNLARISEYVRLGTLDFVLTKPVDAQFMVSLRNVRIYHLLDPVLGAGLVVLGMLAADRPLTVGGVGIGLLLIGCSIVILYAVALALVSAGIGWVSSEGMDDLVQGLVETARLPVSLYRGVVQTALTVVLPVAFLTTIPAKALLGRSVGIAGFLAPVVAVVTVTLASAWWRHALRSYTGASA